MRILASLFLLTLTLAGSAVAFISTCQAQTSAKQLLNDKNTSVNFEVDTTWHRVHGLTSGIHGNLWEHDGSAGARYGAELYIPVAQMDTDSNSRDKELRHCMASEQFPEVIVKVASTDPSCSPQLLKTEAQCAGMMIGTLQIRDITREMKLPYQIIKKEGKTEVNGEITFDWSAFGVEDPSILIARVDKEVTAKFSCDLENQMLGPA